MLKHIKNGRKREFGLLLLPAMPKGEVVWIPAPMRWRTRRITNEYPGGRERGREKTTSPLAGEKLPTLPIPVCGGARNDDHHSSDKLVVVSLKPLF